MKTFFTAFVATLLLCSASLANAASITFNVLVDTSSLLVSPANASAPFALDFQLNGGDTLGNSATITNFNFGGGAATANPAAYSTPGTVSGDLSSAVTLNSSPSSFFNEFYQGFTPGSFLRFDVSLTTNINTPTPDAFSFALLDKTLANIPTSGLGDSLLLVSLNSPRPVLQAFAGTGVFQNVTVAAVPTPEPASMLLLGSGLVAVSARRWRQRGRSRS